MPGFMAGIHGFFRGPASLRPRQTSGAVRRRECEVVFHGCAKGVPDRHCERSEAIQLPLYG
jgi:hypothetical protein